MSLLHCHYSFLMDSSVATTEKIFLMFVDFLGRYRKSFRVSLCQMYYCDSFGHPRNSLSLIIFIVLSIFQKDHENLYTDYYKEFQTI